MYTVETRAFLLGAVIALCFAACSGGGTETPEPHFTSTTGGTTGDIAQPPTNDTNDLGKPVLNCTGDTPVKCGGVTGFPSDSCWAPETDCNTVHHNPNGQLSACKTGEDAHVDGNGYRVCCPGNLKQWCGTNEQGYPGGCHPEGVACSTAINCGDNWHFCSGDATPHCDGKGNPSCCSGMYSSWCEPSNLHDGFCALPDSSCDEALSCDGVTWETCRIGEEAHCTPSGIVCCGGDLPQWCQGGLGTQPQKFHGGCFPPNTDCDSLTPNAQGAWSACTYDDEWGVDKKGQLVCCGNDKPKLCNIYDGVSMEFDGAECLPSNANCNSLQKNKKGSGWNYCNEGEQFGVDGGGELVCCGGNTPLFCALGVISDGDEAYQYSINALPPPMGCSTNQLNCNNNGGQNTTPMKDKVIGICHQCIAGAKSFKTTYPGGCWPDNVACNALVKCGGKYYDCNDQDCFCWDGQIYSPW